MKKFFYSVAAAALVLVASCARETAPVVENEGGLADVTFTLSIGQQTKAMSDGFTVNQLTVGVYDVTADAPVYLSEISGDETIAQGKATFTKQLVKGQKYKLVLWAQAENAPYTATINADGASVVVNPVGDCNDEARDAFWAVVETSEISEGYSQDITLKRAVAQVNILSSDYAAAQAAGVSYISTGVKVKAAPSKVNLLADELEVVETADYDFAAVEGFQGSIAGNNNTLLVTNYVLAATKSNYTVDFDVNYSVNGGEVKNFEFSQDNVPVQRNHRSNIAGNIFTATATFNITVDPIFDTPDFDEELKVEADDVDDVNQALVDNKDQQGEVSYTVGVVKEENTTIQIPAGTAASDITINVTSFDEGVSSLTVTDAGAAAAYSGNINVNVPADTNLDEIVINAPAAHAVLSNGSVTKVIATTGGNTLVIGAGVVVKTVEILKGNVELAGSVETIVRGENNTDELTYVTLVEGYTWKNQEADTAEGKKVVVKADEPVVDPSDEPTPGEGGKVTFDLTQNLGIENGAVLAEQVKEPITLTPDAGTNNNAPKYYTAGDAVRFYGGNTMTLSGATITKVEFTFGSGDTATKAILADSGAFAAEDAWDTWTGSASKVVFTIDGTTGNKRIATVTVTYGEGGEVVDPSEEPVTEVTLVSIAIADGAKTEYTVGDEFVAPTVIATYSDDSTKEVEATFSGYDLTKAGEYTVVATFEGKTAEYKITVNETTQPVDNGNGTLENPFNVAGVIDYIDNAGSDKVYVKGVISEIVNEYSSSSNATFYIADGDLKFEAYKINFLEDKTWIYNSENDHNTQIKVGDEVIIYGTVTLYNGSVYETSSAYLYSLNGVTKEDVVAKEEVAKGDGTLENPFNPAGVKAYVDAGNSAAVYVAGIISSFANNGHFAESSYGQATFYISEDGTAAGTQFEAYQINYLNNVKYASGDTDVKVGDAVVIYGPVTYYEKYNVYETQGKGAAYLYSLNGGASKTAQTLSFDPASVTINFGDEFTAPVLSGAQTTVTYSSTNEAVATVDASTGAVTIVAVGTTIIKAVAAETDEYNEGSASYTITVKDPSVQPSTEPVTVETFASEAVVTGEGAAQTATWTNGDITITAVKGNSNTAFRSTETNLTRFYAGWTITITSASNTISSIEVACDTASYASALANSSFTSGTAVASDTVVTVSDVNASSVSVTLGAQVRASSFTINY